MLVNKQKNMLIKNTMYHSWNLTFGWHVSMWYFVNSELQPITFQFSISNSISVVYYRLVLRSIYITKGHYPFFCTRNGILSPLMFHQYHICHLYTLRVILGPLILTWIVILAWISNHIPSKVYDEIIYTFRNVNGAYHSCGCDLW